MRWIGGVLLLLVSPSIGLGQVPSEWTESFDPVRVADNLFYVGSAGLSVFLLTSDEGHVLIDAPLAENVPMVLQNIRMLGFDPQDIRLHLITHAHFDHVAGLADLVAVTGGEVAVSEGDAPFVESGRDFGFESTGYPPVGVSRILTHLEPITVGTIELVPHVTPGHTPGCTSWSGIVTLNGERQSYVLACSLSPLGVYRLGGEDPTYRGQAADFCGSVAHLETLAPDIFLANHGQFFGLAEKAVAGRDGDSWAFVNQGEHLGFLQDAAVRIDLQLQAQGLPACEGAAGWSGSRTW